MEAVRKINSGVSVLSSFRDPSGFLFRKNGKLLRQVNQNYQENYDLLINSGLYQALVEAHCLISHHEVDADVAYSENAYRVIEPDVVDIISYPVEWSFSQLKDAALLTLQIQKMALQFNMSLKDASAYNIQFYRGRPILIDTLSFEACEEGRPWVAYRQYCQHFLGPLVLAGYKDIRLQQLLRIYIDGIPLDLVSSMLPYRSWLNLGVLAHVHLHARMQLRYANRGSADRAPSPRKISRLGLLSVINSLEKATKKVRWQVKNSEWGDYYEETNYDLESMADKKSLVRDFLRSISPRPVWVQDFGANSGVFSREATELGMKVIALDVDPVVVEKNYQRTKSEGEQDILPLVVDLMNPPASMGWENNERESLLNRMPKDTAMALALIHHLAISNNVPLLRIASFFDRICQNLVIEFIPKEDSQVQRLLATRQDIFPTYTQQDFEHAFRHFFTIEKSSQIKNSVRMLYVMKRLNRKTD